MIRPDLRLFVCVGCGSAHLEYFHRLPACGLCGSTKFWLIEGGERNMKLDMGTGEVAEDDDEPSWSSRATKVMQRVLERIREWKAN